MRVTVDTNLLVRVVTRDDLQQSAVAERILKESTLIAIPIECICELIWVLRHGYKLQRIDAAAVVRELIGADNVVTDHRAVEAGLSAMLAECDFADGVIAHEGALLGGQVFVTFDHDAAARLTALGQVTKLAEDF